VLSAGSGPRQGPVGEELLLADDGEPDGRREGEVLGTSWHGALEHDAFRRALARVAAARGRRFVPATSGSRTRARHVSNVLGDLTSSDAYVLRAIGQRWAAVLRRRAASSRTHRTPIE
jgi:hypothetical protein